VSYDLLVYLGHESLPSAAAWQDAINSAAFSVALDKDFDPLVDAGFVPCQVNGRPGGFEYFLLELDAAEREEAGLAAGIDCCVHFAVHGDDDELRAALAASSTLAVIAGAFVEDPQEGERLAAGAALAWARARYP